MSYDITAVSCLLEPWPLQLPASCLGAAVQAATGNWAAWGQHMSASLLTGGRFYSLPEQQGEKLVFAVPKIVAASFAGEYVRFIIFKVLKKKKKPSYLLQCTLNQVLYKKLLQ